MKLRIQDSILLKEYAAPYHPEGLPRDTPAGWTPDDTLPEVIARADELFAEWTAEERFVTLEFALTAAAVQHRDALRKQKKPQPGWMVVGVGKEDKPIRKAYRELFSRMNEGLDLTVIGSVIRKMQSVTWPPDGFYVFERGVMRLEGEGEK